MKKVFTKEDMIKFARYYQDAKSTMGRWNMSGKQILSEWRDKNKP